MDELPFAPEPVPTSLPTPPSSPNNVKTKSAFAQIASPTTDNKIVFTSKSKTYSFLSNCYHYDMMIDGKTYYHVEGYYEASKHRGIDERLTERIRNNYSPWLAKRASDSVPMNSQRRTQWDNGYKIFIMKKGVYTKFITSSELTKKLLSTGDAQLINQEVDDMYWSSGTNNKGSNMLGKILMEVRDVLHDMSCEPE